MNENAKTLIFVAVAAAAVALAVFTGPSLTVSGPEDLRNQPLYPKFTEPLDVASLEIYEFDDQRGTVHPFKVAQIDVKGKTRWSIPSHDDYPADAKDQVASAAAGLMGLKILEVVSDNQGDQREYGVIDPDPKKLEMGETGVGEKVVMRDENGKELLALIIGKKVPDQPGLYYVRKANEAPIYIVEAKTDNLSTEFHRWIEQNLLGISSMDIKRLWIRDHSVDELNMALVQRGETVIEYDDVDDPKWKLVEDRKFETDPNNPGQGQWVSVAMPDGEELDTAKLDELKNALADLKIVDVARKPAGLSTDLKAASDFAQNAEAVESLGRKGFFVAKLDGQVELFSNEGEIRIVMKDGAEYVLRFGEIATGGPSKKNDEDAKKDGAETTGSGLNRYLFVMADFNSDIIPKPQLEPLPEAAAETENKPEEAKPEETTEEEQEAEEQPKADDNLEAERQRIEKENQRKQDEYEQKLADGKRHAAELNARFADWYYVISDEVYRKIHLNQEEIFKKKEQDKEKPGEQAGESSEPATPVDQLDQLKTEGPDG